MSSVTTRSKPRNAASNLPAPTESTTSTDATAQSPTLLSTSETGPVFFWREYGSPYDFLSQWYPSAFVAPEAPSSETKTTFLTTEQYMMYRKALLFSDTDIASRILREPSPKKQKALGRKVRNFDRKIWDEHKEAIVEEGNWWKFTAAKEDSNSRPGKKDPLVGVKGLAERLLGTGERELVEASPFDRIWGVGYGATNAEENREHWGENLLGKALMRVRDRLRRQSEEQAT